MTTCTATHTDTARTLPEVDARASEWAEERRVPTPHEVAIGMGATIHLWTDRIACTIIAVYPHTGIVLVRYDEATRTDGLGMSDCQSYEYHANPAGRVAAYSYRPARGKRPAAWIEADQSVADGTRLGIGHRRAYHDFSF